MRGGPSRLRDGGVMEMRGIGKVSGCKEGGYDEISCQERSVHDDLMQYLMARAHLILLHSARYEAR